MAAKLNSDPNAKNDYRVIIKCQAGFLTIVDVKADSPLECLKRFQPKAVQSIEEKHGENFFTVFALKGPRVYIASKDIYESNMIQYNWYKTDMKRIGKPVTEYDHENKIFSHS
jgi:hypothetical protein